MLRVRSIYNTNRVINRFNRSRRNFLATADVEEPPAPQRFFTPEIKTAWLNEELESFEHIANKSWLGIATWSAFWWIIWSNLLMFTSLIMLSDEKESTKVAIPNAIIDIDNRTVGDMFLELLRAREFLEELCYRKILAARENLVDTQNWFKLYGGLVVLSCWTYYLYMGHVLGLQQSENVILSFKRMLRRRGFIWTGLALGQIYVAYATVNLYYDTYIMTPQLRGLSVFNDSKREFFSAYGGKGLALGRLMKEADTGTVYDILPNDMLAAYAERVAMHKSVDPLSTSVVPIRSALFTSNWGFKYRSARLNDDIPNRCWFRHRQFAMDYSAAHDQQVEKERKKVERQVARLKRVSETEVKKIPLKSSNPPKSGNPQDSDEKAPTDPVATKFQVGKCFGSSTKEERFLKAGQLEINKAIVARLRTVDLLVLMNNVTAKVKSAPTFVDSALKSLEYVSLLAQFHEQRHHITIMKDLAKLNHEENCLCNYYPYYGGYFAP